MLTTCHVLMIKPVATCRLPQVCAQLGLPADQIMSDKVPHLLLCTALLAAPSAATWLFHAAATAAGYSMADRTAAAATGAGVLTVPGHSTDLADSSSSSSSAVVSSMDSSLSAECWLKLSYSMLPLVWAGAHSLVMDAIQKQLQCNNNRLEAVSLAPITHCHRYLAKAIALLCHDQQQQKGTLNTNIPACDVPS